MKSNKGTKQRQGSNETDDGLSVVHVPDGTGGNPYQQNLLDGLEKVGGVDANLDDPGQPYLFTLERVIRNHHPDVVHVHWLDTFYHGDNVVETAIKSVAFLMELVIVWLTDTRLVWTAHNLTPHESDIDRFHLLYRRLVVAMFLDAVIAHSEAAETRLREAYRLPDEMIVSVVPHGTYEDNYPDTVDQATARTELDLDEDAVVYLFFGQMRPYKGVESLIDAFGSIDNPNARLLVAGDPTPESYGNRVHRMSRRDDRVRVDRGFVPNDRVQYYLRAADVVVLPYEEIFTSGSAMLALEFDRPVISVDQGSNPELLGDAGVLYDDGLADSLRSVSSRDLDALSAAATRAAERYDWTVIGEQTAAVYREVFDRTGKREFSPTAVFGSDRQSPSS